jgi:hypothetical protein
MREKTGKISESTLQHDEERSVEDAIAGVATVTHADYDDMLDVAAWTEEIQRDEVEKWLLREKIDDATQSAPTTTGVAPTRAAHTYPCGASGVVCGVACMLH